MNFKKFLVHFSFPLPDHVREAGLEIQVHISSPSSWVSYLFNEFK